MTLPPKGHRGTGGCTRDEAAKLVWACWRYREQQTVHRGRQKGQLIETDKRPLRHLARFILIGLYTGTRASAIASASPYRKDGHSFVDLDQGIYYRLAIGRRATNKRQTPAPIPPRLLAHMRRWVRRGIVTSHFVEWQGAPVKSVKTGFRHAVELAWSVGKVTPHTLRHTAATWLMQRGVPIWQAAGYLGMSAEMIERTYGHHHPDYMRGAAAAITLETIAERFIGHFIGRAGKPVAAAAKNLMISWWAREDSNLQPSGYEPLALTIELRARAVASERDAGRFRCRKIA